MRNQRTLEVWRRSHALRVRVLTWLETNQRGNGRKRDQLSRAIDSIPDNISEGCGSNSDREMLRYVRYSIGSANEAENHLETFRDMTWMPPQTFRGFADELVQIRRMTIAYAKYLERKIATASRRPSGDVVS